jgi:hypothetical protein
MNQAPAQKRAKAHGRRGQERRLCIEPLEGRWLLSGGPLTLSLRPPIDGPFLVSTSFSPQHSFDRPVQLPGGNALHRDAFQPQAEFVAAEPLTHMALLRGGDVGDPGRQFSVPLVPATEILPQYSDLAGSFSLGAKHDAGTAALDSAFADFGASHDFLPGGAFRFYESNPRSDWIPLSGGSATGESPPYFRPAFLMRLSTGASAEETPSLSFQVSFQVRSTIAADVQEVTALATGALSPGIQEGRAPGAVSTTGLRAPASPGVNRGWGDASQGSGNFGRASFLLGSSPGPAVGVLAWSDTSSGASQWTATPGVEPEDVVASAELEVVDDSTLTDVSPDGVRQEWLASAPQVATLLTEGVTLGVTTLERAVRALAEPMLDAGSAPHGVLYWVGVSSWLAAAALACESVRRRCPQLQTSAPSLLGGPPDPLGGDGA